MLIRPQILPPLLLTFFFKQFLETWNGADKQDMVLEALSFTALLKFQGMSPLRPLPLTRY